MKKIKLITIILLIISLPAIIAQHLIKWNNYKDEIVKSFKSQTGYEIVVEKDISVRFLPLLSINLDQVKIKNQEIGFDANMERLIIYPDIFNLFNKKIKSSGMTLVKAEIKIDKSKFYKISTESLTSINSLKLINPKIIYYNENDKREFEFDDLKMQISNKNLQVSINTYFQNSYNVKFPIMIETKYNLQENSIYADFKAESIQSKFTGSLYNDSKNTNSKEKNTKGSLEINIGNLSNFINIYCKDFKFLNIHSTEEVKIISNVDISNNYINLEDIKINSKSISGSGFANSNIEYKPVIELSLAINNLNLDTLIHDPNNDSVSTVHKNSSPVDFKINPDLDIMADVTINNINFYSKNINTLNFNAEIHEGLIDLYNTDVYFDDKNKISISGALTTNQYRPFFDGEIDVLSDDLTSVISTLLRNKLDLKLPEKHQLKAHSSLLLTPKELVLNDVKGELDKFPYAGSIIFKFSQELPQIFINVDMDKIDFDQNLIFKPIEDKIKTISSQQDLLDLFSPLRSMSYEYNMQFNLANFSLSGNQLQDFSGNLVLSKGYASLEDVSINSDNNNFIADAEIDLRTLTPNIKTSLSGQRLLLDSEFIKNYFNNTNLNLSSFGWVNGKLNINLDKLSYLDLNIKNLISNITLSDQLIILDNLSANIFSGNISSKGIISINGPSFGTSFSLYNVKIEEIFKYFPYLNNLSGYLSVSGSLASEGKNINEIIYKAQSSIAFITKNLIVNDFDLEKIISDYTKNVNVKTNLNSYLNKHLSSGSTKFSTAQGNIKTLRGVLSLKDVVLVNDRSSGVSSGNFDLRSKQFAGIYDFSFIPMFGYPQVNLEITMNGDISNLTKNIDFVKQSYQSTVVNKN